MAGPIEEAGKVASGFMAAMGREPLALALSVMCFALLGFLYYENASFNSQREANVKLIVAMQTEVQKLLSQCIIPAPEKRP